MSVLLTVSVAGETGAIAVLAAAVARRTVRSMCRFRLISGERNALLLLERKRAKPAIHSHAPLTALAVGVLGVIALCPAVEVVRRVSFLPQSQPTTAVQNASLPMQKKRVNRVILRPALWIVLVVGAIGVVVPRVVVAGAKTAHLL